MTNPDVAAVECTRSLLSAVSRLHPQARAALYGSADLAAPVAPPPPVEFDIAELRGAVSDSAAVESGPEEYVEQVVEVAADGVRCRLYRPAPGAPVVVYVHGGAFCMGSLDTHDVVCRRLANRSGWAVFSIDYRLAPEHPFPAGLDDIEQAVRWLSGHGAGLGVDASRLAIAGDSAGANLVAAATLRARDRGGPDYLLQVLVYPFLDLDGELPSRTELGADFGLTDAILHWSAGLYVPERADRTRAEVSPLRASSLAGLPPAVVLTAEFDPLRDEGEEYAAALANAGVPVVATRHLGMLHGFWDQPGRYNAARHAVDQAATALRNLVG